ncbi:MAG: hypothetical protein IKL79_06540 [Clostridia bacterium]|nr:hypothetical protein [Clostridia bacterium]MBR3681646.1 hypothetical protein [Clostridia bacterium]
MSNINDEKRYQNGKGEKKNNGKKAPYIDEKYPHDKKIDPIDGRYNDLVSENAIPGVNTPGVRGVGTNNGTAYSSTVDKFAMNNAGVNELGYSATGLALPAFNPPVPNRAWTAMRAGVDIDELSEEEKRELYYGKDQIL